MVCNRKMERQRKCERKRENAEKGENGIREIGREEENGIIMIIKIPRSFHVSNLQVSSNMRFSHFAAIQMHAMLYWKISNIP